MSLGIERALLPIEPQIVFSFHSFGIANSTLMALFLAIIFFLFGKFIVSKFSIIPSVFQSGVEMIYESIVNLINQIDGNRGHAEKIFPIIATILVYFAVANVIAIVPGLTDITYNGVPLLRTPTSDFNTAFGVSLASIVALNIISLRDYGFLGYLSKFFNVSAIIRGFRKSISAGFVGIIEFFVGLLDIIGEIAKMISLSFRLFGNIYAGQLLSIIIMSSVAYGLPVVWMVMSSFTGILQGMVFAALVAVYYTLALRTEGSQK